MIKIGVYIIFNKKTEDFYIGSSSNIYRRFQSHSQRLKINKHHSIILQRAWNKYKEENFEFRILEECIKEKLLEVEQSYLDILKPKYNILPYAYSTLNRKIPHKEKLRRRKAANTKKVYQFNLSGELLNEYYSVKEASRILNCSVSQIFGVLNGSRKTCKKFYWSYNKSFKVIKPITGKNVYKQIIGKHKITNKKIIFNNLLEASNYVNGCRGNICYCIKNSTKSYKKYYWSAIKN